MSPDDGGFGYDDRGPRRRQQKKSNTSTILLAVAGALVLIGAILIGKWVFDGQAVNDSAFKNPNFVGQTQNDAKKAAVNVELTLTFTNKACEDEPKGNICDQDPKAGVDVKKGDTIALVVSTGAPKVVVPSVLGDKVDEATKTLEGDEYQLDVKTVSKESPEAPGTVLEQSLKVGDEVEKGTTITLTVAKEEEKSTVPDVTDLDCDTAKQQVEANGLVGECTEVPTEDDNQDGKVIATSPAANTEADPGSKVTIQIGKKAEEQKTQVPNVVGQTVGQAKQTLQAAGFTQIQFTQGSDQSDTAFVTAQDPGKDTEVDDPGNTQITIQSVGFGNGNNGGNNGDNDNGGIFG